MLRTGKLFRNAFVSVIIAVAVIYMITSNISYQAKQGSDAMLFVLPSEWRIAIWIVVGVLVLATVVPQKKRFY